MKFKVTHTAPATMTWEVTIEANSEEEAIAKYNDGDYGDPDEYSVEQDADSEGDVEAELID